MLKYTSVYMKVNLGVLEPESMKFSPVSGELQPEPLNSLANIRKVVKTLETYPAYSTSVSSVGG